MTEAGWTREKPIDSLSDHKKKSVSNSVAITKFLFDLSQDVASGNMLNQPHGAIVLFLNSDEPEMLFQGEISWDDLSEAQLAIADYIQAKKFGYSQKVSSVKRRRLNAIEMKKREDNYLDSHTWRCEHPSCRQRFKTERGAKIHERTCIWIKQIARRPPSAAGRESGADEGGQGDVEKIRFVAPTKGARDE